MLTSVLAAIDYADLGENLVQTSVFGVVGIILLIVGFVGFDLLMKKLDFVKELKDKNVAVAIMIAGFFIGLGLIVHAVVK